MPWKVTDRMEERQKFVRRILAGDQMADVCMEFNMSRKTWLMPLLRSWCPTCKMPLDPDLELELEDLLYFLSE
jgi:hypothetical protein